MAKGGHGQSEKYTLVKQNWLRHFLHEDFRVLDQIETRNIEGKYGDRFADIPCIVMDLNAGDGKDQWDRIWSPIIELQKTLQYNKMVFEMVFAEIRPEACVQLRKYAKEYYERKGYFTKHISTTGKRKFATSEHNIDLRQLTPIRQRVKIRVVEGDNKITIPRDYLDGRSKVDTHDYNFGLVYIDVNGLADWELLNKISSHHLFQKVDFLVHISADEIKRCIGIAKRGHTGFTYVKYLKEYMGKIPREYCLVRLPLGSGWQWTHILFTDYAKLDEYEHLGMYSIKSTRNNILKGNVILDYMNNSKEELRATEEGKRTLELYNDILSLGQRAKDLEEYMFNYDENEPISLEKMRMMLNGNLNIQRKQSR